MLEECAQCLPLLSVVVNVATALLFWRIRAMKLMGMGAVLGALRTRFAA